MEGMRKNSEALLAFCIIACCFVSINCELKYKYYAQSCPRAENIITNVVTQAWVADKSITAGLIRLHFHDCFVRGCDASVLLDGPDVEKLGAPNANSLRGFEIIDAAKAQVELACPGVVSCADVLAYAARDSVILAGGSIPSGRWVGGRKDGSISVSSETLTELPAPFLTFAGLVAAFKKKNLSQTEMIVLSGAHTVGRAHCGVILSRLYNFQGTGKADPSIDPTYLTTLKGLCPTTAPGTLINMEMRTPTVVDKRYADDVIGHKGLFESDAALLNTSSSRITLQALRVNSIFTSAFGVAMVKMSKIEVKLGTAGNIRVQCNTTAGAVPGP